MPPNWSLPLDSPFQAHLLPPSNLSPSRQQLFLPLLSQRSWLHTWSTHSPQLLLQPVLQLPELVEAELGTRYCFTRTGLPLVISLALAPMALPQIGARLAPLLFLTLILLGPTHSHLPPPLLHPLLAPPTLSRVLRPQPFCQALLSVPADVRDVSVQLSPLCLTPDDPVVVLDASIWSTLLGSAHPLIRPAPSHPTVLLTPRLPAPTSRLPVLQLQPVSGLPFTISLWEPSTSRAIRLHHQSLTSLKIGCTGPRSLLRNTLVSHTRYHRLPRSLLS